MAALKYLESQRDAQPELAEWYNSLADLYQRKLWHQLTLKLEQFVALAVFQVLVKLIGGEVELCFVTFGPDGLHLECVLVFELGKDFWRVRTTGFGTNDVLIGLEVLGVKCTENRSFNAWKPFLTGVGEFETKINLLKLAHFAVVVSRQYSEKSTAIAYLDGVIDKLLAARELRVDEPILYVKLQVALFRLEMGDHKECKKLLEKGKTTLDSMTDIDPSVYASYYWVSSQYHKFCREFAEFYRSALLYLAYTTVESLSDTFKLDLAFDLSLAALLGDNIYNFGELLAHPIIKSLLGTKVEWLYYILHAFNSGDLVRYQELCNVHGAALCSQPALVENEKKLLDKINILCLMEIIFSRTSEDRTIPLKVIAERTKLSVEDVEHLLMKSLSVR
ncbi:26S proteasome non-ATPase regulatory subunit 13 B [Asimina triloba]